MFSMKFGERIGEAVPAPEREPGMQHEALEYWKDISGQLKGDSNIIAVESLSGNGFTHSGRELLGKIGEGEGQFLTMESGSEELGLNIDHHVKDGDMVVLDEAALIDERNWSKEDLDKLVSQLKSKNTNLVLHVRPNSETGGLLQEFTERGMNAAAQNVEFAYREKDMADIADAQLSKLFKESSDHLVGDKNAFKQEILRHAVVPGELYSIIGMLQSAVEKKTVNVTDVGKMYQKMDWAPHRFNRSEQQLGPELFSFLAAAAKKQPDIDRLSEEDKDLYEKTLRFGLAFMEGDDFIVRTPYRYTGEDPMVIAFNRRQAKEQAQQLKKAKKTKIEVANVEVEKESHEQALKKISDQIGVEPKFVSPMPDDFDFSYKAFGQSVSPVFERGAYRFDSGDKTVFAVPRYDKTLGLTVFRTARFVKGAPRSYSSSASADEIAIFLET